MAGLREGDEKTPDPVKATGGMILMLIKQQPPQVELKADPQAGESGGTSSRYFGTYEKLGVVHEFAGTSYVVDFQEGQHAAQPSHLTFHTQIPVMRNT